MRERTSPSEPAEQGEDRVLIAPTRLERIVEVAAVIVVLVLLVLHTSGWNTDTIDTTSVALVALLLLAPVVRYISRLKIGQVEAEIERGDVRRLRAAASELPPTDTAGAAGPEAIEILDLVRRDPQLGLAKLRIDLEAELKRQLGVELLERPRPLGVTQMLRELQRHRDVPPEIAGPLMEAGMLANQAIHGEFVRHDDAEEIARIGVRALEALKSLQPDSSSGTG